MGGGKAKGVFNTALPKQVKRFDLLVFIKELWPTQI